MATKRTPQSAYGLKHVKNVTAWAILFDGEHAGNVVANFSDNPNGSTCVCTINAWKGALSGYSGMTGKAGGYGYCKLSAAFDSALRAGGVENLPDIHGAGGSVMKRYLESIGYTVASVIG